MRAIIGARVSHVQGPQKVSHIAQHASGQRWATDNGADIVGSFEDLGVSATVSPFDRPDLGQWFKPESEHLWDAMVFSKIDRAFRSISDAVDVARWCKEHRKMLVFTDDGMKLDYRPGVSSTSLDGMMAELFVYLGGFFGAIELARFQERAKASHSVIRQTDRWASGVPPLGYKIIDHPSGKGKALARDPEGFELLHRIAKLLVEDGWSMVRIAQHFNETGVRTASQRARIERGKLSKRPWSTFTVKEAMTSLRTQGFKMTTLGTGTPKRFVPVLTLDGSMIRMAEPTFTDDQWAQIQQAVAKRRQKPKSRTETKNKYLGIGYCRNCGASLSQKFDRRKRATGEEGNLHYYLCGGTPWACKNTLIRAEILDGVVESLRIMRNPARLNSLRVAPNKAMAAARELRSNSPKFLLLGSDHCGSILRQDSPMINSVIFSRVSTSCSYGTAVSAARPH